MRLILISILLLATSAIFSQNKSLLINSGEVIVEGLQYYEDNKYDKAINKYKQVSESDTNYSIALYELGLAYSAQKNYRDAIETFKKGISMETSLRSGFIQQLGNAYSANNEFDKAMETYRNGLKEFPNFFRYYCEMGVACSGNKQPKLAFAYLDSCLKLNFGYARAHYLMGQLCLDNNYFIPAILSFEMAGYLAYDSDLGLTAISAIQKIANGETPPRPKDSVVQLFAKDENNFEDIEEIIRSKSELDARYKVKPAVKLPFTTFIKSMHLVNSRLAQYSDAKGWYAENLVPIYNEWWTNKEFATIMYRMCLSSKNDEAIKMFKKNKELITKQYTTFFSHFLKKKIIYESRIDACKGEYKHLFLYDNSNLYVMIPSTEPYSLSKGLSPKNGYYVFYYNNGNIKKEGNYVDGAENGIWKYYFETGVLNQIYDVLSPTEYTYTKYYSNGQPHEKGHVKDQKSIDKLYLYHTNGVIDRIIPVNDAEKIHGDVYRYYENGMLKLIIPFENGSIKDGEQINYYSDGSIYIKENYKNEKKEGLWTEYYRSGQLSEEGKYKNDKPDGLWKKYHPNGKLAAEFSYSNGELEGSYKEYYDDGTLESESNFVNGDNTGKSLHYDTDGKKFAEYVESKGKIKTATYYDKSGKVLHEVDIAKSGTPFTKYNIAGIVIEEGKALKDFRVGEWKFYSDNGALSVIKEYDNKGSATGKVEEFYVGGAIKEKYELVKNNIDGYYVEYFATGGKLIEGYYVEGMKQGVWKKYFGNGNLFWECYYLNDEMVGLEKTYYPNGNLRNLDEYKEGRFFKSTLFDTSGKVISMDTIGSPNGRLFLTYKNGETNMDHTFVNFMPDGKEYIYWGNKNVKNIQERNKGTIVNVEYDYYPNGNLQEVTYYKYGQMDSIYKSYYENGVVEHMVTYKYGAANGPEIYYHDNGKIELKGEQKNGDREGWFEFYAPDGHLQYRALYLHGILLAYSYQSAEGVFVADIPLAQATGDFTAKFSNGNISAKGSYLHEERHGLYTKYYFNGKKCFETTYNAGFVNGTYIEYFENGKIKNEVTYINGFKEGIEKEYDEKGNIVKETTWVGSYRHGPEKFYKAGKLIKTINYIYDNTYEK